MVSRFTIADLLVGITGIAITLTLWQRIPIYENWHWNHDLLTYQTPKPAHEFTKNEAPPRFPTAFGPVFYDSGADLFDDVYREGFEDAVGEFIYGGAWPPEKINVAIAGGQSIRNAAESAGCAESTAYRTVRTPEFRQRVGEIRTSATDAAVGRFSRVAVDAVEVLRDIMEDPDQPAAPRVTAAAKILAALGPMSELCELRQRLDAIEATEKTGLKVAG